MRRRVYPLRFNLSQILLQHFSLSVVQHDRGNLPCSIVFGGILIDQYNTGQQNYILIYFNNDKCKNFIRSCPLEQLNINIYKYY